MRKTGLLILTFIYLAFTAGVTLQRHFCMNRMSGIRFSAHTEDRCDTCGMEKSERDDSCCHDEQSVYKITDDQQPAYSLLVIEVPDSSLPPGIRHCSFPKLIMGSLSPVLFEHGPPGGHAVPLFIRYNVYRI